MPRINWIEKSLKALICSACGKEIPKGSVYQWVKPRYGPRRVHHESCRFKPTHLSSAKHATIREAIEDAETVVHQATEVDEIRDAVEQVATEARQVADDYQEALDAWPSGNSQIEELMQACSDFADSCESWEPEHDLEEIEKDVRASIEKEDGENDSDFKERQDEAATEALTNALEDIKTSAWDLFSEFSL